jgi:6-pyruvoyl-tetrahydropterin synthase
LRYENQTKRKITKEILDKLGAVLQDDEMNILKKGINKRINKQYINKKKALLKDENKEASSTHLGNIFKYLLKELKYNMPVTTPLKTRLEIGKEVMDHMANTNISLIEAKGIVYDKHGIYITNPVSENTDVTDEHNMHIEREYDEFRGCIVYGWNDDGEALYEPTFGAIITPPTFKEAGPKWREVLEQRWEQRSYYDDDEELDTYIGN